MLEADVEAPVMSPVAPVMVFNPDELVTSALERAIDDPRYAAKMLAQGFRALGRPYVVAEAYCTLAEQQDPDRAGRAWGLLRGFYRREPEAHAAYVHAMRRLRRSREAAFAARAASRLFPDHAVLADLCVAAPLPARPQVGVVDLEAARGLLTRFESIGYNCEFGLLQRQAGATPLGLLRFAVAPMVAVLKLLETRFEGMGDPAAMTLKAGRKDYMLRHTPSGWAMHTCIKPTPETDVEALLIKQCRHAKFLAGKFASDLARGTHILVYQRPDLSEAEIARLHAAVRAHGQSRLLAVRLPGDDHVPGDVEFRSDTLAVGFLDQPGKAAGDKWDISAGIWLRICETVAARWGE